MKLKFIFMKKLIKRKLCSEKLNKHVIVFDYIDVLIVLSATSGGVSIV